MEAQLVSVLGAVLGSLVGGSATLATAWLTQRGLGRRERANECIRRREQLYAEFVGEATRAAIDAYLHSLEQPETLFPLYSVLNRIRLTAPGAVVTAAEAVVSRITDQYFAPPLSLTELRGLAQTGRGDVLQPFGWACRDDLDSLRGGQ